jgi:hypothetical protein
MSLYCDQFHVPDGWRYTEDIAFIGSHTFDFTVSAGTDQRVHLTFDQPPIASFNRVPDAVSTFLVLRHLTICNNRLIAHRNMQWMWNSQANTNFNVPNGGAIQTLTYDAQPPPSGVDPEGTIIPLALRRIRFGTLPAGVTITRVEVKPPWSPIFDDLELASPITGSIDLGTFYDGQYGLINAGLVGGQQTSIQVRITAGNTSGSTQAVDYDFWGTQMGAQWAQWTIAYESYQGGGKYPVGMYDDDFQPVTQIILDKLIPVQIQDTGTTNLGDLIFTALQLQPFNAVSTQYHIMLTATVAYLVPS